jgi:hypothetical protein
MKYEEEIQELKKNLNQMHVRYKSVEEQKDLLFSENNYLSFHIEEKKKEENYLKNQNIQLWKDGSQFLSPNYSQNNSFNNFPE